MTIMEIILNHKITMLDKNGGLKTNNRIVLKDGEMDAR